MKRGRSRRILTRAVDQGDDLLIFEIAPVPVCIGYRKDGQCAYVRAYHLVCHGGQSAVGAHGWGGHSDHHHRGFVFLDHADCSLHGKAWGQAIIYQDNSLPLEAGKFRFTSIDRQTLPYTFQCPFLLRFVLWGRALLTRWYSERRRQKRVHFDLKTPILTPKSLL